MLFICIGHHCHASIDSENIPELNLLQDVVICSGDPISLDEIPVYDVNGLELTYSFYSSDEFIPENQILTPTVVFTANVSVWAATNYEGCLASLEIPIKVIPSPQLAFFGLVEICQGEGVDLEGLNVVEVTGLADGITFHTESEPTGLNLIEENILYVDQTTEIYAFTEANGCREILPILIRVNPAPDLVVTAQPIVCIGQDLVLEDLLITDINNSGIAWSFHNSTPPNASNLITASSLNPESNQTIYAWSKLGDCEDIEEIQITVSESFNAGSDGVLNICGETGIFDLNGLVSEGADPGIWIAIGSVEGFNPVDNTINTEEIPTGTYEFNYIVSANGNCVADEAIFNITIEEAPSAGDKTEYFYCPQGQSGLDLFTAIEGDFDQGGEWMQIDGEPVNMTDPTDIDFNATQLGTFTFQYVVPADEPCLPDTNEVIVHYSEPPVIENIEIQCADGSDQYKILFTSDADTIISSYGWVWYGNGHYEINYIPLDEVLTLTAVSSGTCNSVFEVFNPDCECPFIEPPISDGDLVLCDGEDPTPLIAHVQEGQGINWYDAPLGGNILIENDTMYFSPETELGVYTYYAEAYDLDKPECISEERTAITLAIRERPIANTTDLKGCYTDGVSIFQLADYYTSISDPSETFVSFHASQLDAEEGENAFEVPYSTTNLGTQTAYARVQDYFGCYTIVPVQMESFPDPDIEFILTDLSCSDYIDGMISVQNNDPSQILERSFNQGNWSTFLSIGGLYVGTNHIDVRNQYGCIVGEDLTLDNSAIFDVVEFELECSNNGTISDMTDDVHILTTLITTDDPAASVFQVTQEGVILGTYEYNEFQEIILPVDGTYYTLIISDVNSPECRDFRVLGTLESCSAECEILTANIVNIDCQNEGTEFDPFDDMFTVTVNLTAANNGAGWSVLHFPEMNGLYGEDVVLGPFKISQGDIELIFLDDENEDCTYVLQVPAPEACSNACDVALVDFIQTSCYDNLTPTILTDDIFGARLIATNENIGFEEFFISYSGITSGPYTYNETVNIADISSNGEEIIFTIIDANNSNCTYQFEVFFDPCSMCTEESSADSLLYLNCEFIPVFAEPIVSSTGTYEWQGPNSQTSYATQLNPGFTDPGLYTLFVHHDNDCRTETNIEVVFDLVDPEIFVGDDQMINCRDTIVSLSVGSDQNDILYEWYDENNVVVSTDSIYTTDVPGLYNVQVKNAVTLCTSDIETVEVDIDQTYPDLSIIASPATRLTCQVTEITLSPDQQQPELELSWNGPFLQSEEAEVSLIHPGEFNLQVINTINHCVQETSIELTQEVDYPEVEIQNPDTLNCAINTVLIDGENSTSGLIHQWYGEGLVPINDAPDLSLQVSERGMYFLEIINTDTGCATMDSTMVAQDITPPELSLEDVVHIDCNETDVTLQLNIMNEVPTYDLTWSSSDNYPIQNDKDLNPIVSEFGMYHVDIQNLSNYCASRDSITVVIDPYTIYDAEWTQQDPFCYLDENGMIVINTVNSIGTTHEFKINDGTFTSDSFFEDLAPGDYHLVVRNEEGCIHEDDIYLETPPELNIELNVDAFNTINLGDTLDVAAITNIPDGEITFMEWTNTNSLICDDCLDNNAYPLDYTEYELTLANLNGCEVTTRFAVEVTENIFFYIPNIFNPYALDGNNVFIPLGNKQVKTITEFSIYDRWGNNVFSNQNFSPGDLSMGWNGMIGSKHAGAGVYFYKLRAELINGKTIERKGDITIAP